MNNNFELLEKFVLSILLVCTLIAIGQEIFIVIKNQKVTLADILLLFIYIEVLGMIKDNFGHPVGNIQESPKKTMYENSLSNAKRIQVQEERKNGIGTLAQFFAPQKG